MARIGLRWGLIYMDAQGQRIAEVIFLGPTDNELFRVVIEILFVERRRIHRIKKLLYPIDVNLDAMGRPPPSGTAAELTDFEIESHGHSLWQSPSLPEVETSADLLRFRRVWRLTNNHEASPCVNVKKYRRDPISFTLPEV